MDSLPRSVRDHFRNLGRQYGRQLAEREQWSAQSGRRSR